MAELLYKKLKKDLEQKAIVSADPATTALVVTKSEFIGYKDQTQQTLNQMTAATTKAQEGVDNLVQGKTPVKGLVVYREENTDKNGIAITENSDSNLAIYKVNADGSASNIKLLLNNKEVALKEDLESLATKASVENLTTQSLTIRKLDNGLWNECSLSYGLNTWSLRVNKPFLTLETQGGDSGQIVTTPYLEKYYIAKNYTQPTEILGALRYGPSVSISNNKDLVTKEYVDGKVASIPQPNLTSYAKPSVTNTFTAAQTFNGRVYVNTEPQATNEVATKQYVDGAVQRVPTFSFKSWSTQVSVTITKGQSCGTIGDFWSNKIPADLYHSMVAGRVFASFYISEAGIDYGNRKVIWTFGGIQNSEPNTPNSTSNYVKIGAYSEYGLTETVYASAKVIFHYW